MNLGLELANTFGVTINYSHLNPGYEPWAGTGEHLRCIGAILPIDPRVGNPELDLVNTFGALR
jgi:hypothetical protein